MFRSLISGATWTSRWPFFRTLHAPAWVTRGARARGATAQRPQSLGRPARCGLLPSVAAAALLCLAAGAPRAAATVPFGPGEVCSFKIQYGPVTAGESTIEVLDRLEYDGSTVYHLRTRARSLRFFDAFFKVRDQADSFMDVDSLHTRYYGKHQREGDFRRDIEIHFNQRLHRAYFPDGKEVDTPPGVQDILSAFFKVRAMVLQPGMEFDLPTHGDTALYPLKIKIHSREIVDSVLGPVTCLVVQPVIADDGLFKHEGDLFVWFTDDARRVPIKLRARVPVGAIEAELTAYTPPANETP
jgi:hypothetical protein